MIKKIMGIIFSEDETMRVRPSKNDYFMMIAEVVKLRSPDPKTQVGAVLVDQNDHIIGTGHNGTVPGYPDDTLDWVTRDASLYEHIVHAEINCVLHSHAKFGTGAKLYVTMSPCKDCVKVIASAGIKTVFFKERYKDHDLVLKLAQDFGIQLIQHEVH